MFALIVYLANILKILEDGVVLANLLCQTVELVLIGDHVILAMVIWYLIEK